MALSWHKLQTALTKGAHANIDPPRLILSRDRAVMAAASRVTRHGYRERGDQLTVRSRGAGVDDHAVGSSLSQGEMERRCSSVLYLIMTSGRG
ncbi:hypothetical protein EVAR_18083_1 [Eumeta japonica]|uniref:Uncharacterized protein n=1 Tax=Eumeta variegata TaxID=151549 RepID=A0A4C1VJZ9_EUMVA|nr:hypothetical protein EVAR_18083_1 [Eumeta japonica]